MVSKYNYLSVLSQFPLPQVSIEPISIGLINLTYCLTEVRLDAVSINNNTTNSSLQRWVLQRLNPIFSPTVNADIDAVTTHLASQGMVTPRLVRTLGGLFYHTDNDGGVWRVQTYVAGENYSIASTDAQCFSAGEMLGRFHRVMGDFTDPFLHIRPPIHDTLRHFSRLQEVLKTSSGSSVGRVAAELGTTIFTVAENHLGGVSELQGAIGVVHGDPKLNNIIFDVAGKGKCLIDLDTVARRPLLEDIGDGLRSWCNRAGEDDTAALFDVAFMDAALNGYTEGLLGHSGNVVKGGHGNFDATNVVQQGGGALIQIALELAARFTCDIIEESYFGWDNKKYSRAAEHNRVRALGQLSLAQQVIASLR